MKNRQFIILLLVVIAGFIYLGFRMDTLERVERNVDENVATLDGRVLDMKTNIDNVYFPELVEYIQGY